MKNKEPVLIVCIPGFAADESDSTCLPAQQIFVRTINQHFPKIKIVILAFQYPFTSKEYLWYGNEVIAFAGKNRRGLMRILLWEKIQRRIKKLVASNKVIGILSFWCGECAVIGKRMSKKYSLPFYTWLMGQDAKNSNRFVSRIKPSSGNLIAISDFIKAEFAKNHLTMPAHVIPLGVDTHFRFSDELADRDIDILGVGSLISLKQYDLFIEIIREISTVFPTIKACICGKGPEQERLRSMIQKNQLEDNISY